MSLRKLVLLASVASLVLQGDDVHAQEEDQRVYERSFFDQFAPQNALEMVERLPGFNLQQADEARGLGQGGTNVLINGEPVTGKGETATTRIAQIVAGNVIRIEILDAGTLDLPGFSGSVANIVTRRSSISGTVLWEPTLRGRADPAYGNGSVSVSGSSGQIDYSATLSHAMVRIVLDGPETLSDPDGNVFETRDEEWALRGDQPQLSTSVTWNRPNGHVLNAKTSFDRLSSARRQTSVSTATSSRGDNGSSIAQNFGVQNNLRFDADYSLPALGGDLKLISLFARRDSNADTRLTAADISGNTLVDQAFEEASTASEAIFRFEQQWSGSDNQSWQLAGEGAFNSLDLEADFRTFSNSDPTEVATQASTQTTIEELRGEATLAHRRRIGRNGSLQISIGGELSQIRQGEFERIFFRPKGFASYTLQPWEGWTATARIAREVGQINFRDFAATVSLFDGTTSQDNLELVPQQSWVFSGRAERVFADGHIASFSVTHERISDLVDRIPVGESGDAVGNIPSARRSGVEANITLLGAPFGLRGAQLDFNGAWQWSSVTDPIEGFTRDIGDLRLRDLTLSFRHDLPDTDWAYGFVLQDIKLAPVFRSTLAEYRNVPRGGLTPGTNAIYVEHSDLLGLRARLQVSEFLGQQSRFRRDIHAGRRDVALLDRVEERERSLNGPVITLSLGRSF